MGTYILCQTKRAEKPYYLVPVRMNIYSLEELCYFLVNNLYLVGGSVFNDDLSDWLDKELQLPALAARLRPKYGKFADLQELIYPILKEINYLTYEEMKSFNAKIVTYNTESSSVRTRKKADLLAENGILVEAIQVYRELLQKIERSEPGKDLPESDFSITPVLQHNLGCAWARLFRMDKAAECFWEAYRWTGSDEDLITYLLAFRSIKTPLEYQSRLTELSVEDEVKKMIQDKLEEFRRRPEPQVYPRDIDELLTGLTADYHRSTGS